MRRLRLFVFAVTIAAIAPLSGAGSTLAVAPVTAAAPVNPVTVSFSTSGNFPVVVVRAPWNTRTWRARIGHGNRSLQVSFTRSGSRWTGRLVWYLRTSAGLKVTRTLNLTQYLTSAASVGGCDVTLGLCFLTFGGLHLPTQTGPFLRIAIAPLGSTGHITITGSALVRSGTTYRWVQGNYINV